MNIPQPPSEVGRMVSPSTVGETPYADGWCSDFQRPQEQGFSMDASQQQQSMHSLLKPLVDETMIDDESYETCDWILHAKMALNVAMERIAWSDKKAYMEAVHRVPHIIESEANVIRFLRVDSYHAEAAARRIVDYWKYRVEVFGNDRAYRPVLDLSGNGALTIDNIAFLECRGVMQLPNHSEGRPVLCLDFTRFDMAATNLQQHLRRMSFFWLTKVSLYPAASTEGFEFVRILNSSYFNAANMNRTLNVIRTMMPLKIYRCHLCCIPSDETRDFYTRNLLPSVVEVIRKHYRDLVRTYVARSKRKLCTKLEMVGFNKENLPTILGGAWSYDGETISLQYEVFPTKGNYSASSSNPWSAGFVSRSGEADARAGPADADSRGASDNTTGHGLSLASLEMDAALELMPSQEKQEYQEVMRIAPWLVQTESNPARFLAFEQCNGSKAAIRLVKYWRYRRALLGDRAYRPLLSWTDGAGLTNADVDFIQSGATVQLPNDSRGRAVLFTDFTKVSDTKICNIRDRQERSLFYWLTKIFMELDLSKCPQELVSVRLVSATSFDPNSLEHTLSIMDGIMPLRLHGIHFCSKPQVEMRHLWVARLMPSLLSLVRHRFGKVRVHGHVDNNGEELYQQLHMYDLNKSMLPSALGGNWTYQEFEAWKLQMFRGRKASPPSQHDGDDRKRSLADSNISLFHDGKRRQTGLGQESDSMISQRTQVGQDNEDEEAWTKRASFQELQDYISAQLGYEPFPRSLTRLMMANTNVPMDGVMATDTAPDVNQDLQNNEGLVQDKRRHVGRHNVLLQELVAEREGRDTSVIAWPLSPMGTCIVESPCLDDLLRGVQDLPIIQETNQNVVKSQLAALHLSLDEAWNQVKAAAEAAC